MVVTLLAFLAYCQINAVAITWYMVAAAVVLGFLVAYAAMFGFDKLREAMQQITTQGNSKTGPRRHQGAGGLFHPPVIVHALAAEHRGGEYQYMIMPVGI